MLVKAQRRVLRRAVQQVLEDLREVGGEAGGPALRIGEGGERRHAGNDTVRT